MYVSELTARDFDKIRAFNGTKTIKELVAIFNIENKSNENIKTALDRMKIEYKGERKPYAMHRKKEKRKGMPKVEQQLGLILEVGKSYCIKDNSHAREEPVIYKGRIVKEYERYYLGISETGYYFTIHKMPRDCTVKEIN